MTLTLDTAKRISHLARRSTHQLQSEKMKFFVVIVAALATIAIAAPVDDIKATALNENAVLNSLLTIRSANHRYGEDGPAPSGCYWDGTPGYCFGSSCSEGYSETRQGICGDSSCCLEGFKVLCCGR